MPTPFSASPIHQRPLRGSPQKLLHQGSPRRPLRGSPRNSRTKGPQKTPHRTFEPSQVVQMSREQRVQSSISRSPSACSLISACSLSAVTGRSRWRSAWASCSRSSPASRNWPGGIAPSCPGCGRRPWRGCPPTPSVPRSCWPGADAGGGGMCGQTGVVRKAGMEIAPECR